MYKENIDLTGKKFGYLKVLHPVEDGTTRKSWKVECVCGKVFVLSQSHLLGTKNRNPNRSCGCKYKRQSGRSRTDKRLLESWHSMKARCYKKRSDNYSRYGGAGVTMCDEWRYNFESFYQWAIANGYNENLCIDRIDPAKGYCPENCRWVDVFVQAQNRRVTKNSSTGLIGVYKYKYGYKTEITRNLITYNLGTSKTTEEAVKKREVAQEEFEDYGKVLTCISAREVKKQT